jgi:hypothetical protein
MGSTRTETPAPAAVRWTTTLDDMVDGTHLTAVTARRVMALVALGVMVWGALSIVTGDAGFGAFLLAYSAFSFGMLAFRPLERALLGRRVRHLVDRPCVVSLTDDGLSIRQGDGSGTLPWNVITGVREDGRTLLLVSSRAGRFGIPKRAFASPEAAAAFRDEILRRAAEAEAVGTATP